MEGQIEKTESTTTLLSTVSSPLEPPPPPPPPPPLSRTRGIKTSFSLSLSSSTAQGAGGNSSSSTGGKKRSRKDDPTSTTLDISESKEIELADDNDWQCSICNQLRPDFQSRDQGEENPLDILVSCEGGCLRSFHAVCLGFNLDTVRALESPDAPPFLCKDCISGHQTHNCGICGKSGNIDYIPLRLLGSSLEDSCGAPELLSLIQSKIPIPLATATAAVAAAAGVPVGGIDKRFSKSKIAENLLLLSKSSPSVAPALTPLELVKKALKTAHVVPFDEDLDLEEEPDINSQSQSSTIKPTHSTIHSTQLQIQRSSTSPLSSLLPSPTSASVSESIVSPRDSMMMNEISMNDSSMTMTTTTISINDTSMTTDLPTAPSLLVGSSIPMSDSTLSSVPHPQIMSLETTSSSSSSSSSSPATTAALLAPVAAAAALSGSFSLPASNPKPPTQAACIEPAPGPYVPPIIAGAPSYLVGAHFAGLRKCSLKRCGKFFHYACLRRLSDNAIADYYYRAAVGQKHEPPINVLATLPELDLLLPVSSTTLVSSPKASLSPTSSSSLSTTIAAQSLFLEQTTTSSSSSSSSMPILVDQSISVVNQSLSNDLLSSLDPLALRRRGFESTFFPTSLRPNPQVSLSITPFIVDPHTDPHVLSEPLWHAPGVSRDFICPRHFCDSCELGAGGSFGAHGGVASEKYQLGIALERARRGLAVGVGIAPHVREAVLRSAEIGFAACPVYVEPPKITLSLSTQRNIQKPLPLSLATQLLKTPKALSSSLVLYKKLSNEASTTFTSTSGGGGGTVSAQSFLGKAAELLTTLLLPSSTSVPESTSQLMLTSVPQPPWWPVAQLIPRKLSAYSNDGGNKSARAASAAAITEAPMAAASLLGSTLLLPPAHCPSIFVMAAPWIAKHSHSVAVSKPISHSYSRADLLAHWAASTGRPSREATQRSSSSSSAMVSVSTETTTLTSGIEKGEDASNAIDETAPPPSINEKEGEEDDNDEEDNDIDGEEDISASAISSVSSSLDVQQQQQQQQQFIQIHASSSSSSSPKVSPTRIQRKKKRRLKFTVIRGKSKKIKVSLPSTTTTTGLSDSNEWQSVLPVGDRSSLAVREIDIDTPLDYITLSLLTDKRAVVSPHPAATVTQKQHIPSPFQSQSLPITSNGDYSPKLLTPASDWIIVSSDRMNFIRKISLQTRKSTRQACIKCVRMYHNRKECLPPGCASNNYAFACPAHAHLPLPGETREDALSALKQGLLSAASFSTADLEALYGSEEGSSSSSSSGVHDNTNIDDEDSINVDEIAAVGGTNKAVKSPKTGLISTRSRDKKFKTFDSINLVGGKTDTLLDKNNLENETNTDDKLWNENLRIEFSKAMTQLNKTSPIIASSSSVSKTLKGLFVPPNRPPAHDFDDYRHFCLLSSLVTEIKPTVFSSSSSSSMLLPLSSSTIGERSQEALIGKQGGRPPPFRFIHRNQYLVKVKPEYPESEACECKNGVCGDDCVNRILRVECFGGHRAAALLEAAAAAAATTTTTTAIDATIAVTNTEIADGSTSSSSSSSSSSLSTTTHQRDKHGTNCSNGIHCGNRALQERVSPPLTIAVTQGKGWGAIANADIHAGQFIVEYVGEIIDEEEQDKRLEEAKSKGEAHFYMMEIDSNQIIDARVKSNLARFLNHSCDPNAELQRWSVEGFTRIGIFATRDIKKGEEVAYDYQFFSSEETLCRCGTAKCRGYLGANIAADKQREQEEKEEEEIAAAKRKAAIEARKKTKKKNLSSSGGGGGKKSSKGRSTTDEIEETGCRVCGLSEEAGIIIICDGCNVDHHLACLDPPLQKAPEGDFFCPKCLQNRTSSDLVQTISSTVSTIE